MYSRLLAIDGESFSRRPAEARRVGAAGALTRSRASTTRTRRPQSVAGPRQMALVNFQVHRGTGCSSSRWLRASLQIVLFARPNSISDAPARSTRAKSSALAPWSFERALQNKRSGRWARLWSGTARLGGALRMLQNARSRARAPRPSEDFRPDPYGCSPVCSSLTVAGLAFDILREPVNDQGLYPRVRLKLHKMPCGAPRAAAARRSAVAHWCVVGGVLGAPARPLGRAASMWRVGRRERPKRCGAGVYMS